MLERILGIIIVTPKVNLIMKSLTRNPNPNVYSCSPQNLNMFRELAVSAISLGFDSSSDETFAKD